MAKTPWSLLLASALRLGLTPTQFWRLSLKEWRALNTPQLGEALPRSAFESLARQFPDLNNG
jgi:uncharacterized phage protein (TIGR02216 family)